MKNNSKTFWLLLIATLAWMIFMRPFTPAEIIQFELAKTADRAMAIIEIWGSNGIRKAQFSIYLDFVFLILYAFAISLGCQLVAKFSKKPVLIRIGVILVKAVWIAAALDVIENCAMLVTLVKVGHLFPLVSYYCAAFKFTILGLTLLFVLFATIVGLIQRFAKDKNR